MIVDAFKVIQKGGFNPSEIYITTLRAIDVAEKCVIDRWTQKNVNGYQRVPNTYRLSDKRGGIVRYLLKDLGCFPTSILVNVRDNLSFEKTGSNEYYEIGKLDLGDSKLWLIDGQHRVEALKRAFERNGDFEDYPLVVSILVKPLKFDELLLFYVVNKRQKSVPTDLAFRHLQRMLWEKGTGWLYDFEGARGVRLGLASEVIDYLNTEPQSPWYKRIRMVGDEKGDQFVDDGFFINIVATILKEKTFTGLPVKDFAQHMINYWSCIRELYPEAFEEPEKYTLLSHAGLYVFTMLFPMIFGKLCNKDVCTRGDILQLLERLKQNTPGHTSPDFIKPIDIEFWSREKGPAISLSRNQQELERLFLGTQKKILAGYEPEKVVQHTQ